MCRLVWVFADIPTYMSMWRSRFFQISQKMMLSVRECTIGHSRSLTRVFTVRLKKFWILGYPQSAQLRIWSDFAFGAHVERDIFLVVVKKVTKQIHHLGPNLFIEFIIIRKFSSRQAISIECLKEVVKRTITERHNKLLCSKNWLVVKTRARHRLSINAFKVYVFSV